METIIKNETVRIAYEKLKELQARKLDVTAPLEKARFIDGRFVMHGVQLTDGKQKTLVLDYSKTALQQVCDKLKLPYTYGKRLSEEKNTRFRDLLDYNFAQLAMGDNRNLTLRTYLGDNGSWNNATGKLRAVLSDSYFAVENLDLMIMVLEKVRAVAERGGDIVCDRIDLSDDNFYMRFREPGAIEHATEALKTYRDPRTGNGGTGVVSGFVVRNSETGQGRLLVAPMAIILACKNGMIFEKEAFTRTHLGGKMEEGTWSNQTLHANLKLIESQIGDVLKRITSGDFLGRFIEEIEAMAEMRLAHPYQCTKNVCRALKVPDTEIDNVLDYFTTQNSSRTAFDLCQALTTWAQDQDADQHYSIESGVMNIPQLLHTCDRPEAEVRRKAVASTANLN